MELSGQVKLFPCCRSNICHVQLERCSIQARAQLMHVSLRSRRMQRIKLKTKHCSVVYTAPVCLSGISSKCSVISEAHTVYNPLLQIHTTLASMSARHIHKQKWNEMCYYSATFGSLAEAVCNCSHDNSLLRNIITSNSCARLQNFVIIVIRR